MIIPQVSMQLWYRPLPEERVYVSDVSQPFTAVITHVFADNCVNLIILNEVGASLRKTSVILAQDHPAQPGECEWAPHQVRQSVYQGAMETLMSTMKTM